MERSTPLPRAGVSPLGRLGQALVLVLGLLLLPGCGPDETPSASPGDTTTNGSPTEGAAGTQGPVAVGDPDGGRPPAIQSPRDLLGRIHERLMTGSGLDSQAWQVDVRRLAEALWPLDVEGRAPRAGQVHTQVALICAQTARYILREDEIGREYLARNPEEQVLYDAWLAALVRGAANYSAWCAGPGGLALERFKAARRERILGK